MTYIYIHNMCIGMSQSEKRAQDPPILVKLVNSISFILLDFCSHFFLAEKNNTY